MDGLFVIYPTVIRKDRASSFASRMTLIRI